MTKKVIVSLLSLTLAMGLVTPALADARESPPQPVGGVSEAFSSLPWACYQGVVPMRSEVASQGWQACLAAAGYGLGYVAGCVLAILVSYGIIKGSVGAGTKVALWIMALACGAALAGIIDILMNCGIIGGEEEHDFDMAAMIISEGRLLVAGGL